MIGWHDGLAAGGPLWIVLMMLPVLLPLVFFLLFWALRGSPASRRRPRQSFQIEPTDAREIARQAYARGEMDRERFLEVMEDLRYSQE